LANQWYTTGHQTFFDCSNSQIKGGKNQRWGMGEPGVEPHTRRRAVVPKQ
jgi:hypothetical protein